MPSTTTLKKSCLGKNGDTIERLGNKARAHVMPSAAHATHVINALLPPEVIYETILGHLSHVGTLHATSATSAASAASVVQTATSVTKHVM